MKGWEEPPSGSRFHETFFHEKNLAFDANGFTIALQTWVYEVMPHLARACAKRVPDHDVEIPRILRWAADKPFRFDMVNKFFTAKNFDEFPLPIVCSGKEHDMLFSLGALEITDGPMSPNFVGGVIHKPRRLPTKYSVSTVRSKRSSALAKSMNCKSTVGEAILTMSGRDGESSPAIRTLLERVSSLERIIKHLSNNLCEMYTSIVEALPYKMWTSSSNEEVVNDYTVCDACEHDAETEVLHPVEFEDFPATVPSQMSAVYKMRIREGHAETLRRTIVTHSHGGQIAGLHAPRDLEIDHLLLNEFRTWQKYSSSKLGTVGGGSVMMYAKHSVWTVLNCVTAIEFEFNIDSLINLLLIRLKDSVHMRDNWAALEMICWAPLTSELFDVVFEKVVPFAVGNFLRNFPVEWCRVKKICGVGNISEHWVTYEVSLEGQYIKVYGPLLMSNLWEPVSKPFYIMALISPSCFAILAFGIGSLWPIRSNLCETSSKFATLRKSEQF
ncbi:hypothetical protein C2S53_018541 [Perilla frutescens var. hirtella]|uniref:Uncharacterized protein n=1 Tax=Perilla frutescens var. hirtella TaxID=608512 RepID=A0AAD4P3R7_PERFH|nr:hypothetical protein C2S53_018541 [Perilla frutescens var. hirtella]